MLKSRFLKMYSIICWNLQCMIKVAKHWTTGLCTCMKSCDFSETANAIFTRLHTSLLSKGYCQFVQMIPRIRWPPCPYMVKTHENLQEPRKLWCWILVYSIEDSSATKFVQMTSIGWPLTFLRQGQLCVSLDLYGGGKLKKKLFNMYLRLMSETYYVWLE